MYQFNRLLVGVSFAKQKGASIRYAAMISRLAKSEEVVFLHVESREDFPDSLLTDYPDLCQPVGQYAKEEMEKLVQQYFDGYPETRVTYKVVEGSPLVEFLRVAKEEDIDIIIMRKSEELEEKGTLFEKLGRKAPCSVLFVPEGSKAWFTNILVPVDFSDNSLDAMETAVAIGSAAKGIEELYCLHVYSVPLGYYKTGKSYEQFAEIMKGHAEKNYNEFIKKVDLKDLKAVPIFKLEKKVSKGIEEEVKQRGISLVVVGARGRRAGAGVLLGSVAEHLIESTTVPLMAVKKKGTGMNLLDAILKL
ncbi:MAG: universal stress protein [Thermodesulfobacteriota bacterium]